MLFSAVSQPATVSLFSSTGSEPLQLFVVCTDPGLQSDSFLHFLHDRTSTPPPLAPAKLLGEGSPTPYALLDQTVLHIQGPAVRSTYIESTNLGLTHPWMHLQVRDLGKPWAFEVGVADQRGRKGIIRISRFQTVPALKVNGANVPMLVLPLSFAQKTEHTLTEWSTVSLQLEALVPSFSRRDILDSAQSSAPAAAAPIAVPAKFTCVTYVRVYATCRLRRLWFSVGGPNQRLPWELELYGV